MARSSSVRISRTHVDPMPLRIEPMLAVLSDLPAQPQLYSFEFKWDGVRALFFWDGHRLVLRSRNMLDITQRYPELHALSDVLGGRSAILDAEIVALDELDRPSFALLQRRMHVQDRRSILRLMHDVPAYCILFDVLYLDGRLAMHLPFAQRRDMLEELTLEGPRWRVSPAVVGEGKRIYDAARSQGLEGVVAKRLDSPYEPGKRSGAWIKTKIVQRQEFVVGGWTPEKGANRGRVGRLLLGYYQPGGKQLRYAGSVGSGFSDVTHRQLVSALERLRTSDTPFEERVPGRAMFVKPALVAEVEYRRWPAGGLIQQAAFKGMRLDKKAKDVIREDRVCPATER